MKLLKDKGANNENVHRTPQFYSTDIKVNGKPIIVEENIDWDAVERENRKT